MLDMQDARAPYLIGRTALESGDLSTATIFAQTALERKPNEERILLLAGIIARHRGDYASAIRLLSQAVAINARAAEARAQLGYARILAGSLDGGIEDLESARALMPQEPHVIAWLPVARTRRAVQRIYSGEIELAESDLRRSLEVQPALIEATWNLALLRDTQGDTPGGIQIVQRAIHATPTNANLHLLAAYLLVRQGDMIPAQAALERATGTDSVGLRWLVQGAIHGHFGEYDAAISSFEQARSNGADPGPALALARLDRAAALIRRGRIERALSELRTLGPNLGPNEARVQAGLLSAAMLAQDTGFDELPRLIAVLVAGPAPAGWALDRLYRDADLILGYAQYRQGNERTALEHLERHYANNNNDARVAPLLSTLLIDLAERDHHARRYASAELRLNRAIALTPDNPRAVHNLACVQYNRGNREEAATRFQALREGSHIAEATLNLGLYIDEVKNRGTEAMDLYREYLSLGGIAREVARRRIERKERIFGP
jgi:tetratricopeptide (TPR) repeat protein